MTNEEINQICDTIRNSVSAYDAGKQLGLEPGYDGRCKCFFHGGDHRNLKLYKESRGYYCFVCHAYGDVIRLTKEYMQCSFMDAVEWLNDTFSLHLDLHKEDPYSRRRRAEAYARKLAKENTHACHS